jgi:hypothetical protein
LIALTAPVAPAWSIAPIAIRSTPGISRTFDPSIKMPTRPSTYGGVQTVAPSRPPTRLVDSLSRLDWDRFTPISRAGTAT